MVGASRAVVRLANRRDAAYCVSSDASPKRPLHAQKTSFDADHEAQVGQVIQNNLVPP